MMYKYVVCWSVPGELSPQQHRRYFQDEETAKWFANEMKNLYNWVICTESKISRSNMELPIDDKELATIVSVSAWVVMRFIKKMNLMKEIREQYPGSAYKKIGREQYGICI